MPFITESTLRNAARDVRKSQRAQQVQDAFFSIPAKSVFLSHSHKDHELAEGLQKELQNRGVSLFIDWQDSGMPSITSRETAEKIPCLQTPRSR